jgi:hypothetical protein
VEDRGGLEVVGATTTAVDDGGVLVEVVEGRTTTTDVPAITHPTPWQLYPGRQQPPFGLLGQLEYPFLVSQDIEPAQFVPWRQQPTVPNPVSCTFMHISEAAQQLFGAPIEAQLLVPSGHLKSRAMISNRSAYRICGSRRL